MLTFPDVIYLRVVLRTGAWGSHLIVFCFSTSLPRIQAVLLLAQTALLTKLKAAAPGYGVVMFWAAYEYAC